MNLKELKKAFQNETPVNYKGIKCIIIQVEHTLFGDFKATVTLLVPHQSRIFRMDFLSEKELDVFTLWQELTSPFHQECIDLLKDYNRNKEVQDALTLLKLSIKAAIRNIGSTEHKFSFATSPFGGASRRDALMLLTKELPNNYDVLTDTWTFYTKPESN